MMVIRARAWLLVWAAGLGFSQAASAQPACFDDPLNGRPLYLRGSFNSWNAVETQKFVWACRRWEVVTTIKPGEHSFKAGDEGWSRDADFGAGPGNLLLPKGAEIKRRFDNFAGGVHRFTLTMTDRTAQPELRIEPCPVPPPLGDTVLFLRGSMNNWAASESSSMASRRSHHKTPLQSSPSAVW